MDVNALKDSIIRKQDEIKVLEGRIKQQEREIVQLNRELSDNQAEHEREMSALTERLPVFEGDPSQLPPNIRELKDAIFARISEMESTRADLVDSAVRSAHDYERRPYLTVEQKLERRAKEQESERRKGYISQLLEEKQALEVKLDEQQARNADLQRQIAATEESISTLRKNLRNIMAEAVEDRAAAPHASQPVVHDVRHNIQAQSSGTSHALQAMQTQITELQQQIQTTQTDLRRLAELTGEALGQRHLLEKVRAGAALSQAEKNEVAAAITENPEIESILRNLRDIREKAVAQTLPRLKK